MPPPKRQKKPAAKGTKPVEGEDLIFIICVNCIKNLFEVDGH